MVIKTTIQIDGLQTIISQLKTFGQAGEDAANQLKKAIEQVNTRKLEQDIGNIGKQFDNLVSSVLNFKNVLAATAIGAAATALFDFAKSGIDAAVAIERNAKAAGLSAENYQVLSEAMIRAGGSQEQLNTALRRFTQQVGTQGTEQLKTMTDVAKEFAGSFGGITNIAFRSVGDFQKIQDAAAKAAPIVRDFLIKGLPDSVKDLANIFPVEAIAGRLQQLLQTSQKFRDEFSKLGFDTPAQNFGENLDKALEKSKGSLASFGISLIDVGGKLKTPEKALFEFIDAVSKMNTVEQQASAIVKVFGRQGGPELAKAIREGKAGLEEISNFLKDRGLLFSPDQLKQAHDAEEAIKTLESAYTNFKNQVSVALAPTFIDFMHSLQKSFDDFIKGGGLQTTKDAIQGVIDVAGNIKKAFDDVAKDLNTVFGLDLSGSQLMLGLIALRAALLIINPQLTALIIGLGLLAKVAPQKDLASTASDAATLGLRHFIDNFPKDVKALFDSLNEAGAKPAPAIKTLDDTLKSLSQTFQDSVANMGMAKTAGDKFAEATLANSKKIADAQKVQQGASITFFGPPKPGEDPFAKKAADTLAAAGAPVVKTETLVAPFQEADNQIRTIWIDLMDYISTSVSELDLSSVTTSLVTPFQNAATQIQTIIEQILQQMQRLSQGGFTGFGGNPEGTPFASGGMVRGPGSGTSDSILAWLSNQEFVVNARAVSHYGPDLFAALNSMRLPRDFIGGFSMGGLARAISGNRFAAGGQVSTSGNRTLTLMLGGKQFSMTGSKHTVDALEREASLRGLAMIGKAPSWVGKV